MRTFNYTLTVFVLLAIGIRGQFTKETEEVEHTTTQHDEILNPLVNVILNENEIRDVSHNEDHTKESLSRVKRQFYYDPYYRRRPPIPIVIIGGGGGWFGGRGFGRGYGGRGFGGRGFGGRGFGGRGFGGRGFGGRGFGGGRGIGGFGGRGIGGGRGGRG